MSTSIIPIGLSWTPTEMDSILGQPNLRHLHRQTWCRHTQD